MSILRRVKEMVEAHIVPAESLLYTSCMMVISSKFK